MYTQGPADVAVAPPKRRLPGYSFWFFGALCCVVLIVFTSGVLMLPTMLEFKLDQDVLWRLSSSQRLPVVAIHSVLSLALLSLFGALWQLHIRVAWRKKQHRGSGLSLCVFLGLLAITGVGLYYLGSEFGLLWASVIHSIVGMVFGVFFIWHLWQGSIARRKSELSASL